MAGIGFDLVRLVNQGSYRSVLGAYGLTALMSSGPGIFIILGITIVCFFNLFLVADNEIAYKFLAIIIFLFSSSMILSSFLQYSFFRFIADRIYSNEFDLVTPNYMGVLFVQMMMSSFVAIPIVLYFFSDYDYVLKTLLVSNFIILNMIWISTVLLTGIKSYQKILWAFAFAYTTMVIVHLIFDKTALHFLLLEFLLAQIILLILLLQAIVNYYPSNILIRFDFLKRENVFYSLIFSNFFSTAGFWVDKYMFWFNSNTGYPIFPPLRASPLYDFPMFIAYLAMIPAMAVFMFHIEARFSMVYPRFMRTIFNRKNLEEITVVKSELTRAGRRSILSIFKTQYTVVVILLLSCPFLFTYFNVNMLYINLTFILIIATSFNVIYWGIINILYYMTRYIQTVIISLIFLVCNTLFTLLSLYAGPQFFGYGLSLSLLTAIICGLILLNKAFNELEYYTFMMTD